MTPEPAITVLTAVYNGARFIERTIASIRAQTFEDWEHVIVDDVSDDDTPRIVEELARADARISLVRRTQRGGPYVAANHGLTVARGRWIARIDADDLAAPDRLASQRAFLEREPDLRACAGFWQQVDEQDAVEARIRTIPTSPRVIPWFLCVKSGFIHSSAFVEREALRALGGYRELPVAQDLRLWCDLARQRTLGVVPSVVAHWRSHPASIGSQQRDRQVDAVLEILASHLAALSGEPWTPEQTRTLFDVARARPLRLSEGLMALARWERAWRRDPSLARGERRELGRLALGLRLRAIRANARSDTAGLPRALAGTSLTALRSLA